METAKSTKLAYWIVTILILAPTAGSGIPELFTDGPEQVVQTMRTLGYPLYIMKILGLAKILGAVAIFFSPWNRLKEWAYAGFAFDFLGATASHVIAGDAVHAPIPFVCFVFLMVSHFLWRRLPTASG